MARSSPRGDPCSTSPPSGRLRPKRAIVHTMRPAGSPSRECRSAPILPPAPSSASPASPPREALMNEISEDPNSTPLPDPIPMVEVEEAFEEIDVAEPLVGIIMVSKSDKPKMQPAGTALGDAGIRYEVRVMSAHRDPELVREYCQNARMRGLKVIIAGAGMSAALPGVAAAHTDLPVIGVPILGKSLGGLDALLSAVQMPPGIPVACVAIDGAKNAGVLAARIINACSRATPAP